MSVTIFTKPNCSFCTTAKDLLSAKGIAFDQRDISDDPRNGLLSIYMSGASTLPQVFAGSTLLGGSDDLERLDAAGLLDRLTATPGQLVEPDLSDSALGKATADVAMSDYIEGSDGTKSTDPEELPLLHFYKMFFGWWPNCYHYLHRYPEAYKSFIYATLMSVAGGQARELLGEDLLCAVAFSTSEAQGCGYCQVHTAATTEHSLGLVDAFKSIRAGKIALSDTEFSQLDIALTELAAAASTNNVTDKLLSTIRELAGDKAGAYTKAVGQIASVFGFLNCFNDLTSVEIEGGWNSRVQSAFGVEMGKHAQKDDGDSNPNNLDFDIPKGTLSFPAMIQKYEATVGEDWAAYLKNNLGIAPNWVSEWFQPYQKRHSYMYVSLMGRDGPSAKITHELKHLMAHVSAIGRYHDYLAAIEAYMAWCAGGRDKNAADRVRYAWAASTGKPVPDNLFNEAETAALGLARVSSGIPLVTLEKDMAPLRAHYDQDEIIQLFSACAIAGSIQRWCAVAKPSMEPEVSSFLKEQRLPDTSMGYRFGNLLQTV